MKIAYFTYLPLEYGGGVAKYYITTSIALKKKFPNISITIVTFDERLTKKILWLYSLYFRRKQDMDLSKESIHEIKLQLGDVSYIKIQSFRELIPVFKSFMLIYTTNNLLEVTLLFFLNKIAKLPKTVIGFHIPTYYPLPNSLQAKFHNAIYNSALYSHLINVGTTFHVLNTYDERKLKEEHPASKIKKIYNPFSFELFAETGLRRAKKKKSPRDAIRILWVGRLTEQKGVKDLVWLVDAINNSGNVTKISWSIIGEGELKKYVLDLTNRWSNVTYLGYIKNAAIASEFNDSDIFLSTSNWESFPYTLLEAQSMGLPVVTYDIPGNNDIIEEGENGLLATTREELKEKLVKQINSYSPQQRDYIKKFIRKKFNDALLYKNLYQLFTSTS